MTNATHFVKFQALGDPWEQFALTLLAALRAADGLTWSEMDAWAKGLRRRRFFSGTRGPIRRSELQEAISWLSNRGMVEVVDGVLPIRWRPVAESVKVGA